MSSNKKKVNKGKKGCGLKERTKESISSGQNIVEDMMDSLNNLNATDAGEGAAVSNAIQTNGKDLTDDLLDSLECDVNELMTEQSLEEKIKKHKQLKETTNQLILEVDRLIELMQNANKLEDHKEMNKRSNKLDRINEESGDNITSDMIANLMGEIEIEAGQIISIEQLNEQIQRYQTIMKKIAICKDFYCNDRINIKNIN